MCKTRRVRIAATRELAEAWTREICRSAELTGCVQGEARLRQPLEGSLAEPVLRGIELAVENGFDGWRQDGDGYRRDVEGGYVFYNLQDRTLEIVAVAQETLRVEGSAQETLHGEVRQQISAEGEAVYYEEGFAGRTKEVADAEASKAADDRLKQVAAQRVEQDQKAAETSAEAGLKARAQADAEQRLADAAQRRRAELEAQARQHLETVGVRARQAANRLVAEAYRNAILAYARNRGAENIRRHDDAGTLEFEFMVSR